LENLAILFKKSGSSWFGLAHRSADRPFKGIPVYPALDSHEETELPLRSKATRFLRKPYV